jgi:hypothetical protein
LTDKIIPLKKKITHNRWKIKRFCRFLQSSWINEN